MKKIYFNKLKYTSIIVICIMLLTKVISFVRDLIITSTLGATMEADAFNIAYLLSITVFGFVSSAYGNSIMPIASELYITDRKKMQETVNNIVTMSCIIALCIIALCIIYPNIFVGLLANNLNEDTFLLTAKLARIGIVSLVFLVISGSISILLRIYDRNILPAVSEFLFPIPILIGLLMRISNVYILISLIVVGYLIQALIQYIFLVRCGYKFYLKLNIHDKNFKKVIKLMPPILISTGVLQINTILDNQLAAGFGTGAITSLLLASKINGLAYTVFATSLMKIVYAKLSKSYAEGNINEFEIVLKSQVNTILLFVIPASVSIVLLNKEIVNLLFVRGNFTQENGNITAEILNGYAIGLVLFVLRDICNYCFYASKNTKLPAIVSVISIGINIVLNLSLTKLMGIKGISYATSISAIISLIILLCCMKKNFSNIKLVSKQDMFKYILAIICMVISINTLKILMNQSIIYSMIVMAIGFIVFWTIYFILTFVLKKNTTLQVIKFP